MSSHTSYTFRKHRQNTGKHDLTTFKTLMMFTTPSSRADVVSRPAAGGRNLIIGPVKLQFAADWAARISRFAAHWILLKKLLYVQITTENGGGRSCDRNAVGAMVIFTSGERRRILRG